MEIAQLAMLILMGITMGPVFVVSYFMVLVVHELAHWGVAKLVDPKGTYTIGLGSGRQIASFSMFAMHVNLHAMPVMGYVYGSSTRAWSLWELVMNSAAGLLVNAGLALASFLLVHVSLTGSAASFSLIHMVSAPLMFMGGSWDYFAALPRSDGIVYTFGAMNAWAMWLSLIPIKAGDFMNDGWNIVQHVRAHLVYKKEQSKTMSAN